MLSLNDDLIADFVIKINSDLSIVAKRLFQDVNPPNNLLGFQRKIQRWSQLENIINIVQHFELDFIYQVARLRETFNESEECLTSVLDIHVDMIELVNLEPNGRRYNSSLMIVALKIYMASKSCYKLLRSYFPQPDPRTLTKNIGSFNDIGSEAEAAEFERLNFRQASTIQTNYVESSSMK